MADLRLAWASSGPTERILQALGGQGEGPGEYRWITNVSAGFDESVWVFDASLQRLTLFGADGEPIRTATFRPTTGRGLLTVDPLADGSAWFGRGLYWIRSGEPGVIYRDTIPVGILDGELASFTQVAELPDLMVTTTLPPSGQRSYRAPAFSPRVIHAVWGRCAFVSTGDSLTITVFGPEGEVVRTLTGPGASREVTEADLLVHEEGLVERSTGDARDQVRDMFRAEARVTHLPYYYAMVADEWGQLWLQEYTPPWGVGRRWYVISQSGDRLGMVSMPRELMVFSISRHGVLGSSRGALGEESVELLPFTRLPSEFPDPIPECQEGPR